jgi:dTDP-4-amino-4,6-dideoxygalactose transaminase
MKIEFFKHNIDEADIARTGDVLRSIFLTTGGVVDEFEKKFADYLGVKYAVGLSSCTAALQLALNALNIGAGDEVITTPMSFVATATAIIQAGAKPVFVDVEEATGNINADFIEAAITHHTKAIMPVHLYGQMCDMKKIRAIADKHNLKIIEDAAHCVEGERDGVRPGQLGDAAAFSFYATKSITCGEGGALVTNDSALAEKVRKMRTHGLTKSAADRYEKKFQHWDMEIFGWKYNMDNIQAAMLLGQLAKIDSFWERRNVIYKNYNDAFSAIAHPAVLKGVKHAAHLFVLWVKNRDAVINALSETGIPATVNYRPIHLMSYFRKTYGYGEGMFPVAEKIGASTVTLPLYPKLTNEEVGYIMDKVTNITEDKK